MRGSPIPGLNPLRYRIWTTASEFVRDYKRAGTYEEIAAVLGTHPRAVSREIGDMLGFVQASDDRKITPIKPLHDRIIAEVCAELRVVQRELLSERKGTQLNRARIIISKRLRASGYTVADICRVLQRSDTTVQLYWNKSLRLRRSIARRNLYAAKRDRDRVSRETSLKFVLNRVLSDLEETRHETAT